MWRKEVEDNGKIEARKMNFKAKMYIIFWWYYKTNTLYSILFAILDFKICAQRQQFK